MGSLCCVAARPHASSTASREWSVGQNEPFWRTNSSFSPTLSRGWDHLVQSEGLSYGSYGDGGAAFCDSSVSSNSKESRSWVTGEEVINHHYSTSDGSLSCFSSPSDGFHNQHLMPLPLEGGDINGHVKESASEPRTFSQSAEGTSGVTYSVGSVSSQSDGSEHEPTSKMHVPFHHCNFSSCCSFLSKPVHPLLFPDQAAEGEEAHSSVATINSNHSLLHSDRSIQAFMELQSPSLSDLGGTSRRETAQWVSGASSMDFTDVSEPLELESLGPSHNNVYESSKCGLCGRLLSQRSPWGSRRIVRSGDMPIAGVLSCWHVYHAECLERTIPKGQKHDPPCPLCEKSEENVPEQWAVSKLKNGLPRLRSKGEEGQSRVWSCGQVGDCVEGAVYTPKRSNTLKNQNRLKRHLSLKGNSSKDRGAENSKRGVLCSPRLPHGVVGCSSMGSGPALKRQ